MVSLGIVLVRCFSLQTHLVLLPPRLVVVAFWCGLVTTGASRWYSLTHFWRGHGGNTAFGLVSGRWSERYWKSLNTWALPWPSKEWRLRPHQEGWTMRRRENNCLPYCAKIRHRWISSRQYKETATTWICSRKHNMLDEARIKRVSSQVMRPKVLSRCKRH